jgi:hypothetical protein
MAASTGAPAAGAGVKQLERDQAQHLGIVEHRQQQQQRLEVRGIMKISRW